jgi:hypothetical protein
VADPEVVDLNETIDELLCLGLNDAITMKHSSASFHGSYNSALTSIRSCSVQSQ